MIGVGQKMLLTCSRSITFEEKSQSGLLNIGRRKMPWDEVFRISTAVLTSLGGGTVIIFVFSSWLGKVWASRILANEKHELDKLRTEHEHELDILRIGYEVRFSKLHLERAEAIKMVCESLQKLDDSLHSFLKEFQPVDEPDLDTKIKQSIQFHNKFVELYRKYRIFFPPGLVERMRNLAICSRDTFVDVGTFPVEVTDVQYQMMPELLKERTECWKNARERYIKELTNTIYQLEQSFQEILGIK
jgi:hypothetical protein